MFSLLAQGQIQWTAGHIAIAIVIVAAIIACLWVALRQFGVAIPGWVIQVFWILIVAVVIVLAIKFLMGL